MPKMISPMPQAAPVVEKGGTLTRPWNLWLRQLVKLVQGAADSGSATDVFIWAAMMKGK